MSPTTMYSDALPDVLIAPLDKEHLSSYLAFLAAHASDISIRSRSGAVSSNLAELQQALDAATLDQAQLRYSHDGEYWVDTLIRRDGRLDLVRMQI